ncbi:MAG: hypothetical protein L3J35_11205 [Bacteroidales bacterium]|nr:hypothetical protein [Bacteroidales bacterium]
MKCKYCQADNKEGRDRCFSCNAPLPKRSKLTDKDKESLKNYISSVENMLITAQSNEDGKVAMVLILTVLLWIVIGVLMFIYLNIHFIFTILIMLIIGFVFFMVFGLNMDKISYNAMKKEFHGKIKDDIKDYLKAMHFTISDFETVAGDFLKEDSPLNNFLTDL